MSLNNKNNKESQVLDLNKAKFLISIKTTIMIKWWEWERVESSLSLHKWDRSMKMGAKTMREHSKTIEINFLMKESVSLTKYED